MSIFAIIIIVLVGVIAFFHYTQGFWSATLSAIIAVIAAVLAIGYHESVVNTLLKGRISDYAHAFALVAIFGLTYLILRAIIDKVIPGNLRLPVIVDKVGAGMMGIVAAIFSVGVVAVAAQAMPFGPEIGGYARYEMTDEREAAIQVAGKQQYQDIVTLPQVESNALDEEATKKKLLLPVDEWVIGLVSHLSDGGSLAGKRQLEEVHPNYLDELFAQRLGIQVGANRVAINEPKQQVQIDGLFRAPPTIPQFDSDITSARPDGKPVTWPAPKDGEMYLVARVKFLGGADSGKPPEFVRFSPGSIRLVARSDEEGAKNYFPIGTVENGSMLFTNRIDDYLFVSEGQAADVVFLVRSDEVLEGKTNKVKEGVFIEVKRLAREDLSGKTVDEGIKPDASVSVLRKTGIVAGAAKGSGTPAATPAKKPDAPDIPAPDATPTP
ncbi:MAG TPA: CvpA family protein [Tepidisphaeraceae bacterium]|nr:CvpA family protein [Tepidisphaeraceae bacterium]